MEGSLESVAIVVPTCNRARLLPRALHSVFQQNDHDFELIVVDDGSRDGTSGLVAPLTRDSRVRVLVLERPGGVSAARNRAIEATACDWIVFLDDDDELAPDYLAQLRTLLHSRPELGLVWAGIERHHHNRNPCSCETLVWQDSWDGRSPSSDRKSVV